MNTSLSSFHECISNSRDPGNALSLRNQAEIFDVNLHQQQIGDQIIKYSLGDSVWKRADDTYPIGEIYTL